MNVLLRIGDDTGLYQLYHAVAEHLGMDTQVLLVLQEQEHRVGNGADAQLQAVAVLHQGGDILADGALHIADVGRRQFDEVGLLLHDVIQLADMDEAVTHGAGHLGVDLRDQQVGALGGGLGVVAGNAKAAVAVLIGGAQVQQYHIGVQRGAEQLGDLAEEYGGKVAPALLNGLAGGAAQEQAVVAEVLGIFGQAVFGLAHGHHVHHFHILVLLGIGYHRVGQQDRFAGRMGHYYPVARFNMLYRFLGCGQLLLIQSSPVLHCYTSFSFIIASQAAASCSLLLMTNLCLVASSWVWPAHTAVQPHTTRMYSCPPSPAGSIFHSGCRCCSSFTAATRS